MTDCRQPDLFRDDSAPDVDAPPRAYLPDPADVRAQLHEILGEVRAAESMPWDASTALMYRTIFPQMVRWLPDDAAAQLCFEFQAELERLKAA